MLEEPQHEMIQPVGLPLREFEVYVLVFLRYGKYIYYKTETLWIDCLFRHATHPFIRYRQSNCFGRGDLWPLFVWRGADFVSRLLLLIQHADVLFRKRLFLQKGTSRRGSD